jgi:hypothetical protein
MTPWTWSIAYRRFNQGVLIRFGETRQVGVGTIIRLSVDSLVLAGGYLIGTIPGIIVATSAVAAGVVSEALYAGWAVRPVIRRKLLFALPSSEPLTLASFLAFYIPLAMTSLITLLANPIGSAALSRMPQALASLAAWPVVTGLIFMLRSLGVAFNEVVVALLDEPHAIPNLQRFTRILAGGLTLVLFLIAATPLSGFWFSTVSALPDDLADLARRSIWLTLPLPAMAVLQSWFQGTMLNDRRTRGITEAVVVYLAVTALCLAAGVIWQPAPGILVGIAAMGIASLAQTAWLWLRSRRSFASILSRSALPSMPVEST